jgi:hypothetical protein
MRQFDELRSAVLKELRNESGILHFTACRPINEVPEIHIAGFA